MQALPIIGLLIGLLVAGCQSYSPAPVDLDAHARLFAERVPDAASIRQFAERLRHHDPSLHSFDLTDGLDRQEGQYVALLFNPELRYVLSLTERQ